MNCVQLFRRNCLRYQVIQLRRLTDWLTNGENDLVAFVTRNLFEPHFVIRFYSMAPDGYRAFLERAEVEDYFNLFNLGDRDWDNRPEIVGVRTPSEQKPPQMTSMRDMARALNMEAEYLSVYSFLSKHLHPRRGSSTAHPMSRLR
jgi:hypothetical protein